MHSRPLYKPSECLLVYDKFGMRRIGENELINSKNQAASLNSKLVFFLNKAVHQFTLIQEAIVFYPFQYSSLVVKHET